ncbi:MAG: N-acetylmuramoyl-L-alanine amidase [Planctomycetota bacterium]
MICTPDRDSVVEAVYFEARERGLSDREAKRAAEDVADRLRLPTAPGPVPSVGFYNLLHEQDYDYPRNKRKVRKRGGEVVMRDIKDVDTICIHQTAVEFGVSRRAIKEADGDVELARARRALDVACHTMAFRQGYFVAAHEMEVYVNHANGFNPFSLGLEIDGRYAGLMDDPDTAAREDLRTTWGGEPTELTEVTVQSSQAAIFWMVERVRQRGGRIRRVVSHRQSSANRRSDPGEEIWNRVVEGFADQELGLEIDRLRVDGDGRPVPVAWSPKGQGRY